MNTLVIGGHTRNIGKTSVMAALIHSLQRLNWTAVKITQYGHGICSRDGEPCGCAPREHAFVLSEERDVRGRWDTCRYLAAGARRALWLRVRQGQLAVAFPMLREALGADEHVAIESNSIMGLWRPTVYLVVLDSSAHDFKSSAQRYVKLADALIPVESLIDATAWPGLDWRLLSEKPVFPVTRSRYASTDLSRFVWKKLGLQDQDFALQGQVL
jgi:hypothetical protein